MTHFSHPDAAAILARLTKEQITALYHFTSVENLPYICRSQALCSKQLLESQRGWPPPLPGGDTLSHNLDRRNGNWDKVSLNFTPFTPFAYKKKRQDHLCFLVVMPEVATWLNVIFTDSNAAKTTAQRRGEGLTGVNLVNFEMVHSVPQPWDKDGWYRQVQAETLVPNYIPFSHITKVAFVSKASLMHAERLCDSLQHPPFVVDEKLFTDSTRATAGAIGFPFIDQLALSGTKIDANMLYLSRYQKNIYSKKTHKNIYLTMAVKAMVRTQANIYLHPIDRLKATRDDLIESTDFNRAGYWESTSIELYPLATSEYLIEVHLDNICRASIAFELQL